MPLPLPNLDDLTWEDLLAESRTMIPGFAPEWTDFNPSDPGITVLELFAYHVEALLYRVNRIGPRHREQFLRLVNGPERWAESPRDLSATLEFLRQPARAVTEADFERILAQEMGTGIARVKCLGGRNLERGRALSAVTEAPGDVSVILVPPDAGEPTVSQLDKARRKLDEVRLLGTRVHAVGPRFLEVEFRFTLELRPSSREKDVVVAAADRLRAYFDPLPSAAGPGWPFGRDIHVSELYAELDRTPGVNQVSKSVDPATGRPLDEVAVTHASGRRLRRNAAGDLDAVGLGPDELIDAKIDERSFTVKWKGGL